ncbi:LAFA_0B06546g1_1 [Lachancea sp. 'fantastica']|nr:LAFA_0B06546g1_1 [Lachancea sp. 'fantastica']
MEDSSVFSRSTQDVSSAISLYNLSAGEDASMKAVLDYEPNDEVQGSVISRPLSRSSVTSSLSMVATKDGIEGRNIHRHGIPQYSLNLLSSMAPPSNSKTKSYSKQQQGIPPHLSNPKSSALYSEEQMDSISHSDLSTGAPMTLKEKMKLLNYKSAPLQYTSSAESLQDRTERSQIDSQRSSHGTKEGPKSIVAVAGSETNSNHSTNGDDFSYLGDAKGLPPVFVSVENDHE